MKNLESKLQQSCVKFFDYQYPKYSKLLFAVPNGGHRNVITAKILKGEGVRAGVADLVLTIARNGHNGLFIEMKAGKGVQSESQKEFQAAVTEQGYRYEVCRSLDEFMVLVNGYLSTI